VYKCLKCSYLSLYTASGAGSGITKGAGLTKVTDVLKVSLNAGGIS